MMKLIASIVFSPAGKFVGALLMLGAVVAALEAQGYSRGWAALETKLKDDRIRILRDGKEIDHEAIGADDTGLCALLGGCLSVEP